MRRFTACLITLLALASACVPTAAAARELRVSGTRGTRFPDRAFVLTLPTSRPLSARHVHVLENGVPVSGLTVDPASVATDVGFVLVLDASNSVRGRAVRDVMAAARAFAGRRAPSQKLAVVTFNGDARVVLPFTADARTIDEALAKMPPLARGTHIYDGVETALTLLRNAKIAAGSVVVLSDGADTGSAVSRVDVREAARRAHVRVFSVAVRSRTYDPAPLRELAAGTGGGFSAAGSTAELAGIYGQLGSQLANEYILRYRSHAGPNARIRVAVTVDGFPSAAVTGYVTPALPSTTTPPYHRPLAQLLWQSAVTMVLVSLASAALLALAVMLAVRPRSRTLRKRVAEFVSVQIASPGAKRSAALTDRVFVGAERSLQSTRWWAGVLESLELAQVRMPAIQLVLWTVVGTLFTMWLLAVVLGSVLFAVLGLVVPLIVVGMIKRKVERLRNEFAEQLPDNLQVLASALRAGHSFVGALSVVVDDAAEPSRSEFRRVIADEQLGIPLEDALDVVVRRMENRDLEQVGLVAALQRQTGGNMAEVLDRVTETIRERFELRRMVRTLTAQGRMSRWVVTILPIALLLVMSALNPNYIEPLFKETFGQVLLVLAAAMLVAGSLVIKRIVDIKL
jgi:tight adherence protein B